MGGLETCSPREILKIYAPNEAFWDYSRPFCNFFFNLLKSKNFWRLNDIDKDYKWQFFNNPVTGYIYSLVPLADKRCEIYYLSMEQKRLLYLKTV